MTSFTGYDIAFASGVALLLWIFYGAVWRLYLSPLSSFPGPKLAVLTLWYEFYYDVLKSGGGLYIWKIEELHKIYGIYTVPESQLTRAGPIIRINPYELHIADPDFYEQIYAGSNSPRDKYEWHQKAAQAHGAIGHTTDHKLHRVRKDALSPFFSKRSVKDREPNIKAKVNHLCTRVEEHYKAKKPVNLTVAYLAMCMDIITEYAFGEAYGLLDEEDFNVKWRDTILAIVKSVATITHLAWLPGVMRALPASLAQFLAPDVSQLLEYESRIRSQVQQVLTYTGIYTKTSSSRNPTIFEELRDSTKLPPAEKTLARLADEGNVLLIAASETPAKVLALITYHLLANPSKLQRLRTELATLTPSPDAATDYLPALAQLESLPYLTAVVREGLRLHNGITARSQRIAPHESLHYKHHVIPPGTPVSCISIFMHYNAAIFPSPLAFKPERWLNDDNDGDDDKLNKSQLEKYLVPFGKGTRSCLGYNLGLAELYLTLAAVVGRFEMRLFETDESDVRLERDWFIPQPRVGTRGVRVEVVGLRGRGDGSEGM
ncbi:hypothetical protein MMC16_007355 [Acarospora aff. strigata]|nr:hypothetical protein [Acarospora aff. strigata]